MSAVTQSGLEAAPPVLAGTAPPKEHVHIPPLDGVRGVAILAVLASHTSETMIGEFGVANAFFKLGQLGWMGVDLFFVLSGFLITGILYEAKERAQYFKNFYARRALRIFPLYYFALTFVLIVSAVIPAFAMTGTANPAWMWPYLTNFVLGMNGAGSFGVLDHFWSLAVEEHFYLVWPAIVFFLSRRSLMIVAGCALIVVFLLRVSVTDLETGMQMSGYVFTPMRMDGLAAGSLIALAARGPGGIGALLKPAAIVAPVALIMFASIVVWRSTSSYHDAFIGTIGLSLLWAAFGSMLVLSLTWRPMSGLMSTAVLRWFGKYSYGLYVWHPLIIIPLMHSDFSRSLRGDNVVLGSLMMAFALTLSIGVAIASWNLFEKQFLKLKVRFA